jgi:hypothetical protein
LGPEDNRTLIEVMRDADAKLAQGLAAWTRTDPEVWFEELRRGTPFRQLQDRAAEFVRQRIAHYRAKKQQPQPRGRA